MSLLDDLNNLEYGEHDLDTPSKEVFGIDLGTTYSAIAYINDSGKPEVIQNLDGDPTTPSVLYFENARNVVIGKHAKNALRTSPERVVHFIKRELKNPAWHFKPDEDGEDWTPITVSGLILKHLAEEAQEAVGHEVKDVIITCPAYFGADEHRAVRLAGEWAGLNVLLILDEPVAAALAYGAKIDEPKTILVYDLGGGTFDVTLVSVSSAGIKVILPGGDPRLGGKDWDEALLSLMVSKWQEATGCQEDILEKPVLKAALLLDAEMAKTSLTRRSTVEVPVAPEGYERAVVRVTREEFEAATEMLLNRTISLTDDLLRDAARKVGLPQEKHPFDELVLVGGSTKMPQVATRLKDVYGVEPKVGDPNLSVAKGAAIRSLLPLESLSEMPEPVPLPEPVLPEPEPIYGGDESQPIPTRNQAQFNEEDNPPQSRPLRVGINECLGHSYGLAAFDHGRKVCFNMLLRGQDQQRAHYTHRFLTKAACQRTIDIEIAESDEGIFEENKESQDRLVDINRVNFIQTAKLMLPPGLPLHEPVDVTFSIDMDKILHVNAIHVGSGESIEVKVEGVAVEAPVGNFEDTGLSVGG